jgi:hypothetical protein
MERLWKTVATTFGLEDASTVLLASTIIPKTYKMVEVSNRSTRQSLFFPADPMNLSVSTL